jgi:DNA polymerase-3 subunit gamma/tau
VSQPTGKLSTNNVGINETINPTIRNNSKESLEVSSDQAEDFTFDQLQHVWKDYSLAVRREKRESMYSTLMNSKMTMSSDYQIHLEIANELQGKNLEIEKVELLGFIRAKLKNYSVGLKYSLIESEKLEILDSKGIFDKLAEENSSLNKFRKLFNLDIEF